MTKRPVWLYAALAIAALIVIWLFGSYNGLVRARENVTTAWSQVETQYQRRFDLVPNLVSTVKGAATFEQETLTQVTAARTQWMQAGSRRQRIEAAGGFESALARLLVTVEAYPQLQATQAFRDLMTQLEGTENRISVARRDYNEVVRDYNILVKSFPRNLIAATFGFGPEEQFDAAPGSENAPKVNF
ncbi:MAG: LemA protein [Candidatus Peregrinibacteria bacterium Greene0416_19]|nr:MAG: LemA protein [Candidatus Peregrinibacteria bacterium Greene0416_19]